MKELCFAYSYDRSYFIYFIILDNVHTSKCTSKRIHIKNDRCEEMLTLQRFKIIMKRFSLLYPSCMIV